MALATVKHRYLPPTTGDRLADCRARLRLIASTTDDEQGFVTGQYLAIAADVWQRLDDTGVVTFSAVPPNSGSSSDVIASPAGTRYGITLYRRTPTGEEQVGSELVIAVPDSEGPHWATLIADTMPGDLPAPGAAASSAPFVLTETSAALPNATVVTGTGTSGKFLRGDYSWQTLDGDAVTAADNTGAVQAATDVQGKIDGLERRSVTNRLSSWYSWGHSFGQLGASSNRFLYHRRITDQLGVSSARNQHVSGSKLLSIGARSGGVVNMMQMWEPPLRSYGAQSYPPAAGAGDLLSGINDIQTWATVGDWAQLKEAMRHQYRAACSWSQAAAWWQHDESSTGQAFGGSGSWSTASYVTALEVGPGSSRRRNSSSGATYTVTTGTAEAGLVVALIFLTNYTGGSVYASDISITLDGAAYSTIDTRDVNPSSVATGGVAVARVQLPDDGAAHTIVATAGTGGMEVCGRLVEVPRPFVLCNVARRGGDDGYTPNGSSAIVTEANTMIAAVVAEFTSGLVVLADIDTGVGSSAANFADDLHPNDRGHELIARTILAALDGLTMTAQQRGMF